MTKRKYKAICFDLDGTLLGMDIDEFMGAYFSRIASWASAHDLDPEKFLMALKSGTKAMALSDEDVLNKDVFWEDFEKVYGPDELEGVDVLAIADSFYERDFEHIGDDVAVNPSAARAIEILKGKGYPLVLTTMPMFPLRAVEHRLKWAGVDPSSFERITTYENSKSTKPRQSYFAENLAAMGLDGKDVLMVGNNTMEDMAFMDLGADGFLITDFLLDPVGFDMSTIKNGSLEEFCEWAEALDDCESGTISIIGGPIDKESTKEAYERNLIEGIDAKVSDENSKRLADAIESDVPLGKEGR